MNEWQLKFKSICEFDQLKATTENDTNERQLNISSMKYLSVHENVQIHLTRGKRFDFHHCQTSGRIKLVYELALLILSELMSQITSVDFNNNLRKQM